LIGNDITETGLSLSDGVIGMLDLQKISRQMNEGKRMTHGTKPNRFSFLCLYSLANLVM
jgi:hypothetical protein